MKQILVPISIGELIDKITILKIKSIKINDPAKINNISKELQLLQDVVATNKIDTRKLYKEYVYTLYEINNALWNIEDALRILEHKKQFDDLFIEYARQVYETNDRRAIIKKEINIAYGSELIEEKSYIKYV